MQTFKLKTLKKFIFLLVIYFFTLNIQSQESETTTFYFVRHAEKIRKDKSNKNPELTKQGHARAEHWNTVFKNVKFDLIYSTKYNRTIQTALPTANAQQLEILNYSPNALYNPEFKQQTKGKTVLVVGHSNTTPTFVNDILGSDTYPQIEDNNNANLYILTITGTNKNVILLNIPFKLK